MKARFGILRRPLDVSFKNTPATVLACFILHNFCEAHNEKIADDAARAQMTYERDFQPPTQPMTPIVHNNERGGKETRQIFMKYFE